jgi:chromate transporter
MRVALSAFGGVLPWARRMIVEERGWMSDEEFVDVLALAQLLPGPNIVNVSVAVGGRFHGVPGAVAAFGGLMLAPVTLVIVLGLFYLRFGHLALLRDALTGVAAVAAGLVIAMALRLGAVLRGRPLAVGIALLAFLGAGIARWPLGWVVLTLGPLSVAIAARERR